ncbi:MAG: CPBP family intramembrane metalloprotease [Porphyromonadaceae bacterium]|nr:CPBP family intramembrane metalloprotease [Porphyromonadaceae bacterium]
MLKGIFKSSGTFSKLLLLILLLLFFAVLGMLVIKFTIGDSGDIQIIKINQLLLSFFTLLFPPVLAGYLWYEKPISAYYLDKLPSLKMAVLSIILIFVLSPFINLLAFINEQMTFPPFFAEMEKFFLEMETGATELTKQMLNVDSFNGLMFNLLVMAVMPALGEEIFCRGALLNIFSENRNKYVAIWVVAIIFSLIHFQMYGFLPRMLLGALLGYLLVWSGSLWLPILVHFINNASIVLISYFGKENGTLDTLENLGKAETWGYGIASAVVSAVIILWIVRSGKTT